MSTLFGWCQSQQHSLCRGKAGTRLTCSCRCHGRRQEARPIVDIELPEEEAV